MDPGTERRRFGDARPTRLLLALAATLALIAGCVDAIGFVRVFEVFPANQSGNAVLLGIDIGEPSGGGAAWRPTVAILGFAVGVALAIFLGSRVLGRRRAELLLVLEVLLLTPLACVLLTTSGPATELSGRGTGALLLLTSCAMGMQTEVIRRVAGVAVATTYQSGAIARLAESVTERVSSEGRQKEGRPGFTILLVVLFAYIGGAALGAALGDLRSAIVVPIGLLLVVALPLTFVVSPSFPAGLSGGDQ